MAIQKAPGCVNNPAPITKPFKTVTGFALKDRSNSVKVMRAVFYFILFLSLRHALISCVTEFSSFATAKLNAVNAPIKAMVNSPNVNKMAPPFIGMLGTMSYIPIRTTLLIRFANRL